MNVQESLGLTDRPRPVQAPSLALGIEKRRVGRLGIALAGSLLVHLLLLLGMVALGARTPPAPDAARPVPRPTPVKVVFYETKPRPAPEPPPDTDTYSDAPHRARSEATPPPGPPNRTPFEAPRTAAPTPRRPPPSRGGDAGGAAAARGSPVPPPAPAAATRSAEASLAAQRLSWSPSLREAPPEAGPGAGAGSLFGTEALDRAVQSEGLGRPSGRVTETGPLDFDAKDFEWGPYARKVYVIVDRNWKSVMPLAARLPGIHGKVKLSFRILRSGRVEDLALVQSSGRDVLDQAALASIQLSNPLPALPEEYPREEVGVSFTYYYNMEVGN